MEVHSALPARLSVTVKATDDSGIASVSLYARAPGSPNQGQLLGSTAEASGEVGASAPVAVRTDHPAAPALTYLVAYTLPKPPAYGTPCPRASR